MVLIKRLTILLCILSGLLMLVGCRHFEDGKPYSARDNFETLWRIIDAHYCYFEDNGVDWQGVHDRYELRLDTIRTTRALFNLCAEMVNELRDGHVNLSSPFDVSYYREWWTDYPQNFNLRTLQQYYLDFDYHTVCGIMYKMLPGGVGYMYYPSFNYALGDGNIDYILNYFKDCRGLIIDIRDNGGGELTNVHTLVSHFIIEDITGGYIRHKTGPAHDSFSEPYAVKYRTAGVSHTIWNKPVVLLVNRSCFSAANDFASVMKQLDNVTLCGARTGGGGGMPFTYDLPIGWTIRLSVSPMFDAKGQSVDGGIDPDIEITAPDYNLAMGVDAILDRAVIKIISGE